MLNAYAVSTQGPKPLPADEGIPHHVAWIDLKDPTAAEEAQAEAYLAAQIPTREEAKEIEYSSRLYSEDGVVYMTASVLAGVHIGRPSLTPFTFALGKNKLVTLRYEDMKAFKEFLARAPKPDSGCSDISGVFAGLIEAFVARIADVLEFSAQSVDRLSGEVFTRKSTPSNRSKRLANVINAIGMQGDLASKARESLGSIERLIQFAAATLPSGEGSVLSSRLKLTLRDVASLEDYVNFLLNKITFLLDATLGLVANQQNEVVSVLTVASTILMPPTLIGTVYGMNFANMPELHWPWGYPAALVLMVVSALLPFLYFKHRGWL